MEIHSRPSIATACRNREEQLRLRNAEFHALHPAAAWEESVEAFRRRSPTPVDSGGEGIGPDKPRSNLVMACSCRVDDESSGADRI